MRDKIRKIVQNVADWGLSSNVDERTDEIMALLPKTNPNKFKKFWDSIKIKN